MRLWRRVKVAPGVTLNFSKSGASVSVGPRGSKVTFGRRGVRQTVGLPGTGLSMSRQLTSTPPATSNPTPMPIAEPAPEIAAPPPAPDEAVVVNAPYEVHYGLPLLAAIVIGFVAAGAGEPTAVAIGAALLAFVAGLVYEGFAAHHPAIAKVVSQVVVAIGAVVSIVIGAMVVLGIAVLLAALTGGTRGSRRR